LLSLERFYSAEALPWTTQEDVALYLVNRHDSVHRRITPGNAAHSLTPNLRPAMAGSI
jgi:hypothetical protein